jgi:hypothetical protein
MLNDDALSDLDFAIDVVPEAYGTDLERHPCLQRLIAAQATSFERLADSAFDFTLRSDTHYLEKLADGHIEPIFVHARSLPWPRHHNRIGTPGRAICRRDATRLKGDARKRARGEGVGRSPSVPCGRFVCRGFDPLIPPYGARPHAQTMRCLDAVGMIEERALPQNWSHDDARCPPDRYVLGS